MRKITKVKRSIKAISPIIAVLLLIAIAVVASLVAYAWIMGYIGGSTTKSGNSIRIQSYTTGGNLIVYVQNNGQGTVHLKQDGSVYVNDVLQTILRYGSGGNLQDATAGQLIPISPGQTVELVVNCPFHPGDKVKIVTVEGASAQLTSSSNGSSNSGTSSLTVTNVTVTINAGTGGSVSPSGSQTVAAGTVIGINAIPNSGYLFSTWTFTGQIQINGATSAITTAQINGAGTITANFVSSSSPRLALTVGAGQSITVSTVSSMITVGCYDISGNPVTTGGITVALSSSSSTGAFYSDAGGTTKVTSMTTSSGSSTVSFYYKDTAAGTPTLTASTTGYQSVSTTFTINSLSPSPGPSGSPGPTPTPLGTFDHFAITVPASATAGSSFSMTVTAQDEQENTVTGYSGTVHFTSSDSQAVLPAASTLTSGTGTFTVTLKTAGSETITASDSTVSNVGPLITVNPAAASKLLFTVGTGQSITVSRVSGVVTVQRQDQYGNPVTSGAISVGLASTSSNGRFYSNSGGTTRITTAAIADGSSSANFYYSDSSSGTPTITASYTGLTSATTQFTVNNYQLAYTAGASQNLVMNHVSSAITVQSQSSTGGSHNPGSTLTVTLTSSSGTGTFYSDSAGTHAITTVTISTSSPYSATFYYKDTAQGTPTLTASVSGYTPAVTTFTVTGSVTQLKYTAGTGQSLFVGEVSSVITVAQEDSSSHAVNAATAVTVNLTSSSATGTFYSNSQATGTPITHVTIAAGSSSASFYYKDTAAGSATLTASSSGLTSATTTFTITPNQVPDGGFDTSSPWVSSGNGYAQSHVTDDNAPALSGAYAELDTTIQGTGTSYGALTDTLTPAVALSAIPNVGGSLSMYIYNNGNGGVSSIAGYYSFQITLTASDGTQLVYWWGSSPATAPTSTATMKVMNMGTIQGTFTPGQWVQFSRNIRADWSAAGLSSSASITSIILQGNGYLTGGHQYGQEIFVDNVQIQ